MPNLVSLVSFRRQTALTRHATGDQAVTTIGAAGDRDIAVLANLWYEGWQDAHAAILPSGLRRVRTLASFSGRLRLALHRVWVARSGTRPVGFYMLDADELNQLYVSEAWRGQGVAKALLADAEARLMHSGVQLAWLACAMGNTRAARFYEKSGWYCAGVVTSRLETIAGPFDLEVWRYEKRLKPVAAS